MNECWEDRGDTLGTKNSTKVDEPFSCPGIIIKRTLSGEIALINIENQDNSVCV